MHSIMLSNIFWLLNLLVVFSACNSSVLICMSRLASMIVLPLTRVGIDEVEFMYSYFVLYSVSSRTVPRPRVGSSSLYPNIGSDQGGCLHAPPPTHWDYLDLRGAPAMHK